MAQNFLHKYYYGDYDSIPPVGEGTANTQPSLVQDSNKNSTGSQSEVRALDTPHLGGGGGLAAMGNFYS